MSSRPETPANATGAHRAHRDARKRAAPRPAPRTTPPARYEPCLNGLFTYCLSVLCDHDAATAALGDVLHLAERRGSRGPEAERELRAWLYALARWVCLRRLAEAKRDRQGAHAARGTGTTRAAKSAPDAEKSAPRPARPAPHAAETTAGAARPAPHATEETEQRRHRELAQLAWPEAAGTTPEQREALELAVRHQLTPAEIAAVLGMDLAKARGLLASAACEVERTRAALTVVETGSCPIVARLTGDNQVLLGTALRRELVRHVDDCPRCRRTAERAGAGAWPGTAISPATLPVIEAPRDALAQAMARLPRARGAHPRYNRRGFPIDPKDNAARRDRLRARAVTTTVVATVVAAPVLALWAAYRGAPLTGEGHDGGAVTASDGEGPGGLGSDDVRDYENAGNARKKDGPGFGAGGRSHDVSVEVVSGGSSSGASTGPGRLTVDAQPSGDTTLITLTASGGSPVRWSASEQASWLYLSRSSGTLAPGESVTIQVYVDRNREPSGPWRARVAIAPSGAVISIDGYGGGRPPTPPGPGPRPTDPRPSDPGPSDPGPSDPGPSDPGPSDPGPTDPDPTPTPTDPEPTPSDPGPGDSSPPPGEGGGTPSQG
ncbi:BACON domain-containing protein [Streptomyces sp. G5(2025)]|uniref:BACON domain-containing protein n=1 Tax=Streptomyces sp. G5(2025) TaxID=3406628 RepID=UPI003C1DCBE2